MLVEKISEKTSRVGILNKIPKVKLSCHDYDYNDENLKPTAETLQAMEEVKSGKNLKVYSSFKELMEAID